MASGSRSVRSSQTQKAAARQLLHRARALATASAALAVAVACGSSSDDPEVAYVTISGVPCLGGAVACGDVCTQLASSADNCGACGTICAPGSICDSGQCRSEAQGCSPSALLCGRDCVDPASDEGHCGTCDASCPSDATCVAGACDCPGELAACGNTCVDTLQDVNNCGACGTACVDTQTCVAGSCECPIGRELCSSQQLGVQDGAVSTVAGAATCIDPLTDAQHCGGCGNVCTGGQVCDQGSCACPTGQTLCDGQCIDTTTSVENCGSCGNACTGGQVCDGGDCACPSGQTLCGDTCIDTQSDAANCGACDVQCSLGQACASGSCQSGATGDDGCQGLAQNLSISEVAAYQTIQVSLAQNGQAVQNPDPAVVAGRTTLFRVFVTPGDGWVQRELSARLFLQDGETVLTQYSESTLSIATASNDDDRATTFEFIVPPERITDQTQFAVEVVECGTGAGAAASPRFPATGGADLGAIDTGGLKLHLVPLRANGQLPDTSEDALNLYRLAFLDTYPISRIEITVGDPVDVADPEDWANNLDGMRALRLQQQPPADVYYYGLLKPTNTFGEFCGNGCIAGIGYIPQQRIGQFAAQQRAAMGLAYADDIAAFTMLHEVGHNHGRSHAPCAPGGGITGVDPNFPQPNGAIGAYGYNALGDQLIPPNFTDLMGYCNNQWLSAYTYGGILDTIVAVNGAQPSVVIDPKRLGAWRVLLVDGAHGPRWGIPMPSGSAAAGLEETARVLDAAGAVIDTVPVYRTPLSDTDAASLEIPAPKPGWHSIQIAGAPAIEFQGAR